MSGQPAARLGDATLKGGPIVQGAAGVMIGAINGKACSTCDERHYFIYDAQHRLNHYEKHEENHKIVETHYQYDPLGRRVSKVSEIYREGKLIEEPHYWYGWEGDRLVTTEHNEQRIHTIYDPSAFTPLIRLEQALPLPEASKFLGDIMEAEMVETGIKLPKLVKDRFNRVEEEIVILNGKLIG